MNIVPSNFFSSSHGIYSVETGDAVYSENISISSATESNVGKVFKNSIDNFSACVGKIYFSTEEGKLNFLGTATAIAPNLLITAGHTVASKVNRYFIAFANGQIFPIDMKRAHVESGLDYALLPVDSAVTKSISKFPDLLAETSPSGMYGYMHFGNNSAELQIAVGEQGSSTLSPELMIDGGSGSSGALLFNDKGKAVGVHLGASSSFMIRSSIYIRDIIEDELARYGESHILNHKEVTSDSFVTEFVALEHSSSPLGLDDDEEAHGTLKVVSDGRAEKVRVTARMIDHVIDFLENITSDRSKKRSFYAKIFQEHGRLYEDELLRIDIQNPPKGKKNIQIQIGSFTVATFLVSKELGYYGENPDKQCEVVNHLKHKLIGILNYTKRTGIAVGILIKSK